MLMRQKIAAIKKKFGYDDLIKPSFLLPDSENLVIAQKNDEYFHVKLDGTPAYKQRFEWVGPFCEGLASVRKGGKFFHIRPDGTPAYEERFEWAGHFLRGRSRVREEHGEIFFIRPDGARVD